MHDNGFKTCSFCKRQWQSRADFLADPSLRVVGYQADLERLDAGLLIFVHQLEPCGTSIAVPIGRFFDLYTGPTYSGKRAGLPECPRYCLDSEQLNRCAVHCECARARETMGVVVNQLASARNSVAYWAADI
ncbi:MAG: hypothetical protein P4L33_08695 [Capsulimonadaceae bacterium]|nr:hypothetical protein [Capsulimonadaceae bacterium]